MATKDFCFSFSVYSLILFLFTRINAQENRIHYSLFEEAPAYTYVGDVPGSANLQRLLNTSLVTNLIFSILATTNPHADYFMIDEKDGILRTKDRIDRDILCPQQESCILKLDIAVKSPPDYFEVIKLAIVIQDKNDNVPKFSESQISRSIPENTEPGRSFSIPLAQDLDSPRYGIKEYRVMEGSPEFKLKVIEDTNQRPSDLYLVLDSPLDREQREKYRFIIGAMDGGSPPNSGSLEVDIIILDVNDHPPRFVNQTFLANVYENVTKGSVITKVKAIDPDSGPNGEILYSFTSKTQQDFGSLFRIDNITGEIRVWSSLDFETRQKFTLQVTAQDKNGEWLPAESKVQVSVLDVNDNAPVVTTEALATSGQVEILEGEPKGSYIAFILVQDPDTGLNGQFHCGLENPDFHLETMHQDDTQAEYKLVTAKPLDREKVSQYDLDFICSDKGTPILTSTSVIRVTVVDVNDNAPLFTNSVYMTSVTENQPSGTFVVQVSAVDRDEGLNGVVRYTLMNYTHNFYLDSATGNLTTWRSFDREADQEFSLTIVAKDMATPPMMSYTKVIVKVKDINDEPPKFNLSRYTFGIKEDAKFGDRVGQVTAQDPDLVGSRDAKYSLIEQEEGQRAFSISPATGEIFTRAELDRETQAGYTLVVKAMDGDNDKLSSTVTVSIYVIDINDNPPKVEFPSLSNNTVHVANMPEIGRQVTQILAQDPDSGSSARISFYLSGNDEAVDYFNVHERTGHVITRKPLSAFTMKEFTLNILVTDAGLPPLTVPVELRIVVNSSLADASTGPPLLTRTNMIIVISVAVISAITVIILIVAIIMVKRNDQNRTSRKQQYLRNLFIADQKSLKIPSESKEKLDHSPASVVSKKEVSFSNDVTISDEGDEQHKQLRQMSSEAASGSRRHTDASHPWDPAHPNYQFYREKSPGSGHMAQDPDCSADSDSGRGSNEEGDCSSRPSCTSSLDQEGGSHRHKSGSEYGADSATKRSQGRSHDPGRGQAEVMTPDLSLVPASRGLLYSTNVQLPRTSTAVPLPPRQPVRNELPVPPRKPPHTDIPRPGNIDTRPHNTRTRLSSSYV